MSNGLDKDYLRSVNYNNTFNETMTKAEYIANRTQMLQNKRALLEELQSEAKDCVVRGIMPSEDTLNKIKRLKNDIIPSIESSIRRERERM